MGGWPWDGKLWGCGQGVLWERGFASSMHEWFWGLRIIPFAPEWSLWVWSP